MRVPYFSIITRDRRLTSGAQENMRFNMHDIWREMNRVVSRLRSSERVKTREAIRPARIATVASRSVDVVHIEKLNYETGR